MSVKIVIEVPDAVFDLSGGVDLRTLIRDAMSDFAVARDQGDESYIERRYQGQDDRFKAFKRRELKKRLMMAQYIARGDFTIVKADDE